MTTTAEQHDARLVRCTGEIDMGNADRFTGRLRDAIEDGDPVRPVTIDLRTVEFFGSAAVAVLDAAREECRRRNVPLRVLPSKAAYRTLELVGRLDHFNLVGATPQSVRAA